MFGAPPLTTAPNQRNLGGHLIFFMQIRTWISFRQTYTLNRNTPLNYLSVQIHKKKKNRSLPLHTLGPILHPAQVT